MPYKHEDVQTSNAFAKLDSIMHSPVEMVQFEDVENTAKLIAAFTRRLEPGLDLRR